MGIFENKTESKTSVPAVSSVAVLANSHLAEVLLQPRISEKATRLANKENKYVFVVKTNANKISIRKAVEAVYKVKVLQVNIIRNNGKLKNFGRTQGRTSDFKKAIVTLKEGEKIEAEAAT